jgi:hypothetical protein
MTPRFPSLAKRARYRMIDMKYHTKRKAERLASQYLKWCVSGKNILSDLEILGGDGTETKSRRRVTAVEWFQFRSVEARFPRGDPNRQAEANQAPSHQPHRQTVACPRKRKRRKLCIVYVLLVKRNHFS